MSGYYVNRSRKIIDFLIGFFGLYTISLLLMLIVTFIFYKNLAVSFIAHIAVVIAVVYFSLKKRRYYILIGVAGSFVVPLLIFGACLGVMAIVY